MSRNPLCSNRLFLLPAIRLKIYDTHDLRQKTPSRIRERRSSQAETGQRSAEIICIALAPPALSRDNGRESMVCERWLMLGRRQNGSFATLTAKVPAG